MCSFCFQILLFNNHLWGSFMWLHVAVICFLTTVVWYSTVWIWYSLYVLLLTNFWIISCFVGLVWTNLLLTLLYTYFGENKHSFLLSFYRRWKSQIQKLGQLPNLQGSMQNENTEPLVQKVEKHAIKDTKM